MPDDKCLYKIWSITGKNKPMEDNILCFKELLNLQLIKIKSYSFNSHYLAMFKRLAQEVLEYDTPEEEVDFGDDGCGWLGKVNLIPIFSALV